MKVIRTKLDGCYIIEPNVIPDSRGYFMESYNERAFEELTGLKTHFVQDNESFSSCGVLRGLHYQTGDHAQAKLVRVLSGEVLDVAVDIRPDSETFGQHVSVLLSEEKRNQFYIPKGFAHGFLVMSQTARFFYKCDQYYNRESEGGIAWNDASLAIDWNFGHERLIISQKDNMQPALHESKPIW